jgi:hypothetical protein
LVARPGGSASRCRVEIRRKLLEYRRRRKEKDRGEDTDDWMLNDPSLAWDTWTLMEATGWKHLPHVGGLLDQPQALMDDLMTIAWVYGTMGDERDS